MLFAFSVLKFREKMTPKIWLIISYSLFLRMDDIRLACNTS